MRTEKRVVVGYAVRTEKRVVVVGYAVRTVTVCNVHG